MVPPHSRASVLFIDLFISLNIHPDLFIPVSFKSSDGVTFSFPLISFNKTEASIFPMKAMLP